MTKHKNHKHFVVKYRWLVMGASAVVITASLLTLKIHNTTTNFATEVVSANTDLPAVWANFPGASPTSSAGVHFAALDRKIVNQDGTGGAPNPDVNVGGSHLNLTGDFDITLTMSELSGGDASFRLYRDVPIIYDEWRYDGTSVDVRLTGQQLKLSTWNGRSEKAASVKTYDLGGTTAIAETEASPPRWQFWRRHKKKAITVPSSAATVAGSNARTVNLKRQGSNLLVFVDDKQIASLSVRSLFSNSKLWFGAEATGNGWTLDSMSLGGNATLEAATTTAYQPNATSLGKLASQVRPTLKIGTAVSLYPLMTDESYRQLALSQFTQWTPENAMKSQFIHPSKDTYSFEEADLLVDTALKNNISVHGHALVFGEANATWMQKIPAAELKKVMEDHITTIMKHYAGKVAEWDVVNEPLDDYEETGDGFRQTIWYKAMGRSFIADALTTAHAADPKAKLYINEYGLEEDGDRWDTFLTLVRELKKNNVPLDGIGFQSHIYDPGDEINPVVLRRHMQQLASLGVVSRVSEIDAYGEDASLQAKLYQDVLSACRNEASCTSYSSWGFTDKYGSTTIDHTYPPEYNDGLLWDVKFQPKPVVTALTNGLK